MSYIVRCGAVRYGVVRCGAVRCGAVRCGAVRCGAVRCGARYVPGATLGAMAVAIDSVFGVLPASGRRYCWCGCRSRRSTMGDIASAESGVGGVANSEDEMAEESIAAISRDGGGIGV